jgi:asparagine synthase (glutamine-hydrolysing)
MGSPHTALNSRPSWWFSRQSDVRMMRFIAVLWNQARADESARAGRFAAQLRASCSLQPEIETPGLLLFCIGLGTDSNRFYRLPDKAGAVIGVLFERIRNGDVAPERLVGIPPSVGLKIQETAGADLIHNYWGRYVAFIRDHTASRTWVLQDPSAALPLFHTATEGVHVYFSDLKDIRALGLASFSMNLDYLRAYVLHSICPCEATGLAPIDELQGGQCHEYDGSRVTSKQYWLPRKFAIDPIEDPEGACALLRTTVFACVQAWASCFDTVLHQLSGGLDSSIALSALVAAKRAPAVTCVNYYSEGGRGDERSYARAAADAAHVALLMRELSTPTDLTAMTCVPAAPRPAPSISRLHEEEIITTARSHGAKAITSGNAGDAVFGEIRDVRVGADYRSAHGINRNLCRVIGDTARLTETTVWQIIRATFAIQTDNEERRRSAASLQYQKLLSADVRAAANQPSDRYTHPWLRAIDDLPPVKRRHISMLAQPMTVRTSPRLDDAPEWCYPLASQPIIELSLALPTYLLTLGGQTRALARRAFVNDVPPSILTRRDKGHPGEYLTALIQSQRALLREYLLDGKMVNLDLLDARAVEQALSGQPTRTEPTEILWHLSTEIWLRNVAAMNSPIRLPPHC